MIIKANSYSDVQCWTTDYSRYYEVNEWSSSCWSHPEFQILFRSFSWSQGSVWNQAWSINWSRGWAYSWFDYRSNSFSIRPITSIKKSKCWSRNI